MKSLLPVPSSLQLHQIWGRDKFGPNYCQEKKQICMWGRRAHGRSWVIIGRTNKERK